MTPATLRRHQPRPAGPQPGQIWTAIADPELCARVVGVGCGTVTIRLSNRLLTRSVAEFTSRFTRRLTR